MPRRALAVLSGIARRGAARMPHFARRTRKSFLANPDKNDGAQEASGIGRISFGYFSLSAQRKVSRPWVREPTLKNRRGSDTLIFTSLCSGFRHAAQVPTCLPHLTYRDVGNAGNRKERLQPRHPWRSSMPE
ncbi:hypothetical protein [Methyloglobulus sp.]|uniref:hypothetical protein n=1 Tax=Methyloglobulus sp. TaxID=2518622 RepID=UPI0032B7199F